MELRALGPPASRAAVTFHHPLRPSRAALLPATCCSARPFASMEAPLRTAHAQPSTAAASRARQGVRPCSNSPRSAALGDPRSGRWSPLFGGCCGTARARTPCLARGRDVPPPSPTSQGGSSSRDLLQRHSERLRHPTLGSGVRTTHAAIVDPAPSEPRSGRVWPKGSERAQFHSSHRPRPHHRPERATESAALRGLFEHGRTPLATRQAAPLRSLDLRATTRRPHRSPNHAPHHAAPPSKSNPKPPSAVPRPHPAAAA